MDNSFVFPVPLPVIQDGEKQKTDETISELKKQTDLMEGDSAKNQEWMKTAMVDSKEEKKQRKQETVWGKLQDKIYKQWDKIGIAKSFKWMFGKIGEMTKKLGGMMGGFLSGLFNDLMELMLFAAVDPNGGLLASFIGALIPLFLNLVFMIANVLVNVIPMIIKMVISYIPQFIKALSMLFTAIVNAIPMIVDAFIIAVPILFKALTVAVPKIVTALAQAIQKIVLSLKDKIPFFKPILDFLDSFSKSLLDLFNPSGGELKDRIGKFAESIFENLYTFFTTGIFGITEDIKKSLKKIFPEFEKLIDFVWNFIKVLAIVGAVIGVIILGIKVVAIIGALIAAWPILLLVALTALTAYIMTYWDDIKNYFGEVWDDIKKSFFSSLEYLSDLFFDILDIVVTGIRILLLPFTWPLELGLLIYKNWTKLSKKISDVLDGLLNIIGKVFGSDIKNKIQGSLESIKNFIKSFSIGDMIRNSIAGAFNNIPGLNGIREFFMNLLSAIKNSPIGKAISDAKKMLGGMSDEASSIQSVIQQKLNLNINDKLAEFIKNSGQYGYTDVAKLKSIAGQDVSQDFVNAIDSMVKAIKESTDKPGGKIDTTKMEDLLAKNLQSKPKDKLIGALKSSTTMVKD